MRPTARTPEELETLFEDAFIVRDADMFGSLFERGAVFAAESGRCEARGDTEIARAASAMWSRERTYIADVRRVVQVRDTALSVGRGINVLRRGADGSWRFAIALLDLDLSTTKEK
jgi:hypothetical protein